MVLILGMHRSGTSCLAGMLGSYGLDLGEEIHTRNNFNKKGNQEHLPSRSVNHELVILNGGSWFDPQPVKKIPAELRQKASEIKKDFREKGKPFGIKDPRMLFCLDVWMDDHTRLVGTIRHPELVVRSLETRNAARAKKVDADWYHTWMAYNRRLLELQKQYGFPIVNFDWPEGQYQKTVKNIAKNFGLAGQDEFFESNLRHHDQIMGDAPSECLELYEKLSQIADRSLVRAD